jgi:predicted ATPase
MSEPSHNQQLHLPSLSIKGFRGIADLSIPRLGRVTLITGKNNTGKTSILEGVRLFAEGATPEVIREILQFREESTGALSRTQDDPDETPFLVSALFHGFPTLWESSAPVVISCCDGSRRMEMEIGWFVEMVDEDDFTRLVPIADELIEEGMDIVPALVVEGETRTRIYPMDRLDRIASNRRRPARSESSDVASRFVNATGPERTGVLGPLWDNILLTERESYVIQALQIIDRSISAVGMIGDTSSGNSRIAVVRSNNFNRRVPLRSFGDGMNRLFGVILSLVNVSGGILLIDEFENGMHHAVQVEAWRLVFRLANELDVQVLATTHSFDCVAGFMQAASETEESEGVLVRIDRYGNQMRAVEYTEEDLLVAVNQRIEVR